ncbi:hypothetical protein M3O96_21215 [Aquiflexum sp. TKW24L]|uniref:hypothetical protein n=1 Tax=Aquiflexum sp. TKW24L TaxID=2942212 RepID=UPI0020C1844E|nr:hypothetical protein [Aquiflexum sp. TKW24L]MCL6261631.1 hypothetical protein [Aquiflexum sp. TKW24L]
MKLPSLFRTAQPMRFDIKPRFYDPVKEEIEQRTARIKKELQLEGKLPYEEGYDPLNDSFRGSAIRGAFTQGSPIKGKSSSPLSSTGFLRLLIFLVLMMLVFGYVYLGPDAVYYMLYFAAGILLVSLIVKLKGKLKQ